MIKELVVVLVFGFAVGLAVAKHESYQPTSTEPSGAVAKHESYQPTSTEPSGQVQLTPGKLVLPAGERLVGFIDTKQRNYLLTRTRAPEEHPETYRLYTQNRHEWYVSTEIQEQ